MEDTVGLRSIIRQKRFENPFDIVMKLIPFYGMDRPQAISPTSKIHYICGNGIIVIDPQTEAGPVVLSHHDAGYRLVKKQGVDCCDVGSNAPLFCEKLVEDTQDAAKYRENLARVFIYSLYTVYQANTRIMLASIAYMLASLNADLWRCAIDFFPIFHGIGYDTFPGDPRAGADYGKSDIMKIVCAIFGIYLPTDKHQGQLPGSSSLAATTDIACGLRNVSHIMDDEDTKAYSAPAVKMFANGTDRKVFNTTGQDHRANTSFSAYIHGVLTNSYPKCQDPSDSKAVFSRLFMVGFKPFKNRMPVVQDSTMDNLHSLMKSLRPQLSAFLPYLVCCNDANVDLEGLYIMKALVTNALSEHVVSNVQRRISSMAMIALNMIYVWDFLGRNPVILTDIFMYICKDAVERVIRDECITEDWCRLLATFPKHASEPARSIQYDATLDEYTFSYVLLRYFVFHCSMCSDSHFPPASQRRAPSLAFLAPPCPTFFPS